ncbi:MAG: hypothetical protein ACK5QX_03950 [bacterium]|jgi:hypothetical protein
MEKFHRVAKPVTNSDVTVYEPTPLAFVVVTGGNLATVTESGDTITYTALTAGQVIPVRCRQFLATGSTAVVAALY